MLWAPTSRETVETFLPIRAAIVRSDSAARSPSAIATRSSIDRYRPSIAGFPASSQITLVTRLFVDGSAPVVHDPAIGIDPRVADLANLLAPVSRGPHVDTHFMSCSRCRPPSATSSPQRCLASLLALRRDLFAGDQTLGDQILRATECDTSHAFAAWLIEPVLSNTATITSRSGPHADYRACLDHVAAQQAGRSPAESHSTDHETARLDRRLFHWHPGIDDRASCHRTEGSPPKRHDRRNLSSRVLRRSCEPASTGGAFLGRAGFYLMVSGHRVFWASGHLAPSPNIPFG